jgi:hypothetical protein
MRQLRAGDEGDVLAAGLGTLERRGIGNVIANLHHFPEAIRD